MVSLSVKDARVLDRVAVREQVEREVEVRERGRGERRSEAHLLAERVLRREPTLIQKFATICGDSGMRLGAATSHRRANAPPLRGHGVSGRLDYLIPKASSGARLGGV